MGTKTLMRTQVGFILILGGLLASCGTEGATHTVGPPTKTVGQFTEWPEGFEPTEGADRRVEMPEEAKRNAVLASPDAAGSQDYFHTLRR